MSPSRRRIDTDILFSIPFLLSLAVLVLNDHIGKGMFHNTLTGKLSDFTGLFAFVLFWRALLPRHRHAITIGTALWFIFWKSPYSSLIIDLWNSLPFGTVHRTVDYTDYIALLILPLALRYESRPLRFVPSPPVVLFMGLVAILPLLATTCHYPRPPYHGFTVERDDDLMCEPDMSICRKVVEDENGDEKYVLTDASGAPLNGTMFDCIRVYDPISSSWIAIVGGRFHLVDMHRQGMRPSHRFLEVNIGGDCDENECEGGRWGIMNTSGTMIVPPEFDAINHPWYGEMFLVAKRVPRNQIRFGLIDTSGKVILRPDQDSISLFSQGIIRYRTSFEWGRKWGLMAPDGREILPAVYDTIGRDTWEGMAVIVQNGRWGFIDSLGVVRVPPQFDATGDFVGGIARALSTETLRWGFIDTGGRFIVQPVYVSAGDMRQGLAWVRRANEKIGYINVRGEMVIPPQFDAAHDFQRGMARVRVEGEERLIDRRGRWFTHGDPGLGWTVIYRQERPPPYGNGRRLYGYMDSASTVVIEPRFVQAFPFSEGLARVQPAAEFLFGYIDSSGKLVIPALHRGAGDFHEGLASVELENTKERMRYGYIDRGGRLVIDGEFLRAGDFSRGLASVMMKTAEGNRYGFINQRGEMVIAPRFEWAEGFTRLGTSRITVGGAYTPHPTVNPNLRWGLIDTTGKVIIEPVYEKLWYFTGGRPEQYVGAEDEGGRYEFDVTGKRVRGRKRR